MHSTDDSNKVAVTGPKKLMPVEYMDEFKAAVDGSDLSKTGLVEVLKKRFQGRCVAGVIKSTLEEVAVRVGEKEKEKRWRVMT